MFVIHPSALVFIDSSFLLPRQLPDGWRVQPELLQRKPPAIITWSISPL